MVELEFHFHSGTTRVLLPPRPGGHGPGPAVANMSGIDRCLLITDDGVPQQHVDGMMESLKDAELRPKKYVVPAGDDNKSLVTTTKIYNWLTTLRADRYTAIVSLGGGMIGDLAGFVAATWMRGIPWISCPTTVLAMIDACLGGKVGVNRPRGKNLIGVYYHPRLIWADATYLQTLSDETFAAGLAESAKHAVARDGAFLDWHEENIRAILARKPATLTELVERNLRIKGDVVSADERERGHGDGVGRAALNFGHTVGHALESVSGFTWSHGECVALGMIVEMDAAVRAGKLSEKERDRVESMLAQLTLPRRAPEPFDPRDVIHVATYDKKARRAKPRLVVPDRIGHVVWLEPRSGDELAKALKRIEPEGL